MDVKIEKGLIACFDILGYRGVLKANDVQTVLRLLDENIGGALARLKELEEPEDPSVKDILPPIMKSISRLVFSDTVIFAMPLDVTGSATDPRFNLHSFIHFCCDFMTTMFNSGLPARGAVHYGEYYIGDAASPYLGRVAVGKGIIKAFETQEQHDWSGCGITFEAEYVIRKMAPPRGNVRKLLGNVLVRYDIPLKAKGSEPSTAKDALALNYLFPTIQRLCLAPGIVLSELISEKFSQHGKSTAGVERKIQNTEAFLSHCLSLHTSNSGNPLALG